MGLGFGIVLGLRWILGFRFGLWLRLRYEYLRIGLVVGLKLRLGMGMGLGLGLGLWSGLWLGLKWRLGSRLTNFSLGLGFS